MSAELLREAAAKMRERAEAATSGPWMQGEAQDGEVLPDGTGYLGGYEPTSDVFAMDGEYCTLEVNAGSSRNAEHIASWHPAVALAVADWLRTEAAHAERGAVDWTDPDTTSRHALAVARAYLGRDS